MISTKLSPVHFSNNVLLEKYDEKTKNLNVSQVTKKCICEGVEIYFYPALNVN